MNIVLLELNSYAQTLRLFINGTQPAAYSELSNFTFQQALKKPGDILGAIGREVNDDFELQVIANRYEYYLIARTAENDEYCVSCQQRPAKVTASTKARAERLANRLSPASFIVCVNNCRSIPEPALYGTVSVSFTADRAIKADCVIDTPTPELALAASETLLVNPLIGRAVAAACDCANEIAICSRLIPILSASIPRNMEVGHRYRVTVSSFPAEGDIPNCYVKTSNPAVVSVDGVELVALGTGTATIQVFVYGENQPFFSGTLDVKKTVLASKLEFMGLDESLHEGDTIPLSVRVFPSDAEDAGKISFESSDSNVAKIQDGKLILTGNGPCEITARASQMSVTKKITVMASLTKLKISQDVFTLNVGNQVPVTVEIFPKNAHNATYRWESSDKTVAVVVEEDGREYIKSVGIGTCELTCRNVGGTAFDTCTVHVNSIMYKKTKSTVHKGRDAIILFVLSFLTVMLFFSSRSNTTEAKQNEGTQSGTSPSETTRQQDTEPIDTNMLHDSDLETIKAEAAEMVGSSLYSGELLQGDGSWAPVAVEYSGYFVRDVTIVTAADCNVDLIFEVLLVNPKSATPHTLYAVVQYNANHNNTEGLYFLRIDSTEPHWYAAIADLFSSIDREDFYETSFSVEELGAMLGWDEYLSDRAVITDTDADVLIKRGHDMLSDKYENITFDSACLYVSNNKFSPTRNELYLYFKQEKIYGDGTCVTYYFPLHASNIKVTTDSSGNAKLDLDSIAFTQEDYLTELPKNRGWVPLTLTENTSE